MKIIKKYGSNEQFESSDDLRNYIEEQLNYLEIETSTQKGLLFFLGASLVNELNHTNIKLNVNKDDEDEYSDFILEVVNLFSKSKGDFSDFGNLNDHLFEKTIYNTALVIYDVLLDNNDKLDSYLRKIENTSVTVGKTELDKVFIDNYSNQVFSLNTLQNLFDDFFKKIGMHLHNNGYSNQKSYEAGFAYYNMQIHMDIKGSMFLFQTIRQFMPPIYRIFWNYPIIFKVSKESLYANNVFSSILQFHLQGLLSDNIISLIYKFHQNLFYEPETYKFREVWNFKESNQQDMLLKIFYETTAMRDIFEELREDFINHNEVYKKDLIDIDITRIDMINRIVKLVYEKYKIQPLAKGWNSFGDYLQSLAIFYYECCMHIMLPKELKD